MPRDSFVDDGFQLQGSAMLLPQTLQAYVAGSKINGQYGDPWDVSVGANWFPLKRRELRVNTQFLYLDGRPSATRRRRSSSEAMAGCSRRT